MKIKVWFTLSFFFIWIACFSNDTLTVAVYDKAPFGGQEEDGSFSGLMVDLWEDIADELDLEYTYELVKMKPLLNGINSGKYDVGLGAISVTPEREKLVDFTHAVNPSGTTIGVSKAKSEIGFFRKWRPVFVALIELITILLVLFTVGVIIIKLMERKFTLYRDIKAKRSMKTIALDLWRSIVSITATGYDEKGPMRKYGRVSGFVWIFISIVLFSLFTVTASSKLAETERYRSKITSIEDLYHAKVISVANSSGEAFLKRERVRYDQARSLDEAIDNVVNGDYDAVVYNAPVLKYYSRFFYNNSLSVNENYLLKNNMAMALKHRSKLKEKINLILLEKISEPNWQMAAYKYIGQ